MKSSRTRKLRLPTLRVEAAAAGRSRAKAAVQRAKTIHTCLQARLVGWRDKSTRSFFCHIIYWEHDS